MKKEFMELWKNLGEMEKLNAKIWDNVITLEKLGLTKEELTKLNIMFINMPKGKFNCHKKDIIEMYRRVCKERSDK